MSKIDKAKTKVDEAGDDAVEKDEAGNEKPEAKDEKKVKPKTAEQIEAERQAALALRKTKLDQSEITIRNMRGGEFFKIKNLPGMEKSKIRSEFYVPELPDMKDPKYKGKKMRVFVWFHQNGGQDYRDFITDKIFRNVMDARAAGEPIALVVMSDFEAGRGHTNWNAFRDRETYSAIIDHVEKLSGGQKLANNVTLGASSGGYKGIAHILQNMQKSITKRAELKKIDRSKLSEDDKARYDAQMAMYERDSALYAGIGGVGLFDSLYGYEKDFAKWATSNPLNRLFSYWGTTHTTPHNKTLKNLVTKFYKSQGKEVPSSKVVYPAPHIGHDVGERELMAFLMNSVSSDIEVPPRRAKSIPINVDVATGGPPARVRMPVSAPPSPGAPPSRAPAGPPPSPLSQPSGPPLEPVTPAYPSAPSRPSKVEPPPAEEQPPAESPPAEKPVEAPSQTEKPAVPETPTSLPPGPFEYKPGNEKPKITPGVIQEAKNAYNQYPTQLFTNFPANNPKANLEKIFGKEKADVKRYIIFNDPLSPDPENPKPCTFLGRKIHGGINMMCYVMLKIAEEFIMKSGVNYVPAASKVLGFSFRNMMFRGKPDKSVASFHKFGMAVDLDPAQNGPKHGRGNIPDQVIMGAIKAGFAWGMVQTEDEPYFSQDPMHIQPRVDLRSTEGQKIVDASPVGRRYWSVVKLMMDEIERGDA